MVLHTATREPSTTTVSVADALSSVGSEIGTTSLVTPEPWSLQGRRPDAAEAEIGESHSRRGLFDVAAAWPMSQENAGPVDPLIEWQTIEQQKAAATRGSEITVNDQPTLGDFGGSSQPICADMLQTTESPTVDSSSQFTIATGVVVAAEDGCLMSTGVVMDTELPLQSVMTPTMERRVVLDRERSTDASGPQQAVAAEIVGGIEERAAHVVHGIVARAVDKNVQGGRRIVDRHTCVELCPGRGQAEAPLVG